ncbi:hypothetical protein V8E52_008347 [Russula decolorans]
MKTRILPFPFAPPIQEPITIRTRTPAASVSGSLCGDDIIADSPGGTAMDVDMPPSLFGSTAAVYTTSDIILDCAHKQTKII